MKESLSDIPRTWLSLSEVEYERHEACSVERRTGFEFGDISWERKEHLNGTTKSNTAK